MGGKQRSFGMSYSDHHAGQFVRKTKVSAVVRIHGHIATVAEARTERMATELLERTPPNLLPDQVRQELRRQQQGHHLGPNEEALRPLSCFVQQEAARVQMLVSVVRRDLQRVRMRLAGHLLLGGGIAEHDIDIDMYSEEKATESVIDALMNAEVPASWLRLPACANGSLATKATAAAAASSGGGGSGSGCGLGRWFAGLQQCHEQIWRWVFEGPPKCFWMAGLTDPVAFIAAVRQEACQGFHDAAAAAAAAASSGTPGMHVAHDSSHRDEAGV